jgi:hypothetical protein
VRREDQLSAARVGFRVLEQGEQVSGQPWMEAGVDLVEEQDLSGTERAQHWSDEPEPPTGSRRLILDVEGKPLIGGAVDKLNQREMRSACIVPRATVLASIFSITNCLARHPGSMGCWRRAGRRASE